MFEGNSGAPRLLKFPVTISNPSGSQVSVTYQLYNGSAGSGEDFATKTELTKTLKFTPPASGSMVTTKFMSVRVVPDTVQEGDEHLTMELFDASGGYSVGRRFAKGTILDDDGSAGQAVAIAGSSLCEGDTSAKGNRFMFQITLRDPAAAAFSPTLTVTNGTATGGADFKALPKPKIVKFGAGQVQKTVTLTMFPETNVESSETVVGTITSSALPLLQPTATAVILNDDS